MGFFVRINLGRSAPLEKMSYRTEVKQTFKIKVPKDRAEAVQRSLEEWVESMGWAAIVDATPAGDFVEFTFKHDESRPGKPPDMPMDSISEDLQKVLENAVKP